VCLPTCGLRATTFRELKADNAILLGNGRTNPWLQPFEAKLGIRWQFDKMEAVYYPVDTWQANRSYLTRTTRGTWRCTWPRICCRRCG
jgi:hypothetical protein